jgi:hypothetical protein
MKACQTLLFKKKLPIKTTESKWKYKDRGPLSKANVKDQGVSDTGDHNSTTNSLQWSGNAGWV